MSGPAARLIPLAVVLAVVLAAVPPVGSPAAAVLGARTAIVLPLPFRTSSAPASWDLEMVVLNLMNQERVASGLPALMPHATMRSAARLHAQDMFAFGYLSHRSRDGRMPHERVLGLGVRVRLVGENLAYAQDVRQAHQALMDSEGHRQNILFPAYRLVGIGVSDGGPYGIIVVQNFGD